MKSGVVAVRAGSGKIVHAADCLVPGCVGAYYALCGSMRGVGARSAGFLQVYSSEVNCPNCLAIMDDKEIKED